MVSPETAGGFRRWRIILRARVQQEIHVPIGLVVDAVGGTPAEAWTSAAALRPLKDFDVPLAELERLAAAGAPEYGNYVMHWYDEYDIGLKGNWSAPDFDDSDWKTVDDSRADSPNWACPTRRRWSGSAKRSTLPDPLPPRADDDFPGHRSSGWTRSTSTESGLAPAPGWRIRAFIPLPDGVLKPGKNVIAIRVFKTKPDGGFMSKPDELHLVLGDKTEIPLAGEWKGEAERGRTAAASAAAWRMRTGR